MNDRFHIVISSAAEKSYTSGFLQSLRMTVAEVWGSEWKCRYQQVAR